MPPPTEPTLLSRYLLPPSSLTTILPYNTFLSLLPSNIRTTVTKEPQCDTALLLKRLYKDLQHQRDIEIETVRLNIQRECSRSEVLKARLRREVRDELGENTNVRGDNVQRSKQADENARKRKRGAEGAESDPGDSEQDQISIAEDDDEESTTLTEAMPRTTSTRSGAATSNPSTSHGQSKASYDGLSDPLETRIDTLFSGPRGLAAPTTSLPSHQRYHTATSLLQSMQQSVQHFEKEIADLDAQAGMVLEGMKETVGGMSDLRYGKFARVSGVGEGTEEDGGLQKLVTEALRDLMGAVGRKKTASGIGKQKGRS